MRSAATRVEIWMRIIALVLGLLIAKTLFGQTLATAETLGKGKVAGFAATNALVVKDFPTLSLSMAQAWYGVSNRTDAFVGISDTVVFGQHQAALMAGGNVNLLKSKVLSVSTFNTISLPINRRSEACGATWFTALVVSKNLQVRKFAFTPYSSYTVLVPVGQTANKLYTPAEPTHNVPVGVMIPKGKFAFFAEYNFGRTQQIVGIGFAYTLSP